MTVPARIRTSAACLLLMTTACGAETPKADDGTNSSPAPRDASTDSTDAGTGTTDVGTDPTDAGTASTEGTWEGSVSRVVFDGEVFSNIWAADGALWAAGFRLPSTTADPDAPQPGPALQCPQNSAVDTVVRRRNGDAWDLVEQPAKTGINGMHGAGADDLWLVGFDGTVVQFTGGAWQEHDVRTSDNLQFSEEAELCSELSLYSVFARTPNDVWVVGRIFPSTLGPGLVLHFDGERWERHAVAAPEGLADVWAGAANDVWAVGSAGLAYHYDGDQWTRIESETDAGFSAVFGVAQNDVWIAGDGGTLHHFDGGALTVSTDIEQTTATRNFSGDPAEGTFLLTTRYGNSGPERQDVWTYDNDSWHSIFENDSSSDFMSSVAVTPEGELWVAGESLIRLR